MSQMSNTAKMIIEITAPHCIRIAALVKEYVLHLPRIPAGVTTNANSATWGIVPTASSQSTLN
jgi:hypothetical protein